MKLSWIFTLCLVFIVTVFSVQNARPIEVRLLFWELSISSALVIMLAALLGGLVGLAFGLHSRSAPAPDSANVKRKSDPETLPFTRETTHESP